MKANLLLGGLIDYVDEVNASSGILLGGGDAAGQQVISSEICELPNFGRIYKETDI